MGNGSEKLGLVKLWDKCYAYLQKDEGLGWSNAGMVRGKDGSLLVDTLFDLNLTQTMEEMLKMTPETAQMMKTMPAEAPAMEGLKAAMEPFDFSGIELTPPTRLFDDEMSLEIDDSEVKMIHVGPAHTSTDVVVFHPEEKVLFAGDIIFRLCTPIGWEGTFDKWIAALDKIVALEPTRIVPGHGPLCGVEGAIEMKEYLQYVYKESRECFDKGLTEAEAAKKIDPGPYAGWTEPERIIFSVDRAYREFRGEPHDTPVDFMAMASVMAELRGG
jgi:hypothetical protein